MWNFLLALITWESIKVIWPTIRRALGFILPLSIPGIMDNRLVEVGYIDFEWTDLLVMGFTFSLIFDTTIWLKLAKKYKDNSYLMPEEPGILDKILQADNTIASYFFITASVFTVIAVWATIIIHAYYYIMY